MAEFEVILAPAIQRDLRKLSKEMSSRILENMQELKRNPYPNGDKIKKIATSKGEYRLRVGDYRVIYRIEGSKVVALRVVDRKDFDKILRDLI